MRLVLGALFASLVAAASAAAGVRTTQGPTSGS
jgi:hypothetical protein